MALVKFDTITASENGKAIEINHPTKNTPMGIRIIVCGSDSKTYQDIANKQQNRRFEKAQKARGLKLTAEEVNAEALELLVGCTKGWESDILDNDGNVVEKKQAIELNVDEFLDFTPDNARLIYRRFPFIREQIEREIGDRANFLED